MWRYSYNNALMTASAQSHNNTARPNLRPFELRRDLLAVADLVELCFADRLDADGQTYVRQMRTAARNARILGWAASAFDRTSMPMGGFVWWENSMLVGNLSLLPVSALRERAYLIANVAVHPDRRRRGIARALTEAALEFIRTRNIKWSWLQVDDDNPAALDLYHGLGFSEQARRTTWHSAPTNHAHPKSSTVDIKITFRRANDWAAQETWLGQIYPPEVMWHLPLRYNLLQPGWQGATSRLFSEKRVRQWSLKRGDMLMGVLTRQSSPAHADKLWLATSPEFEDEAIQTLLPHAQRARPAHRTLALDYPAGRAADSIKNAGFYNHQTLVWMKLQV